MLGGTVFSPVGFSTSGYVEGLEWMIFDDKIILWVN